MAFRRRTALAALAGWGVADAGAQSFPARPVQMVVPAAPGGPVGSAAAILAAALSRRWRQRVLLQHVPGGGTVPGVLAVARSQPDGYHLGLATSALPINAALRSSLPYDTLGDLVPVSLLASFQYGIFAHRSLPVRNVTELIAHAQRSRRPLRYASPGIGTGPHVAMEAFAFEAGIKVAHTPFMSSVPAEKAVLAGELPLLAYGVDTTIEAARHGPLQLVALMGNKAGSSVKGVSWASDAVPGFEITGHVGVIAPRAVPAALINHLGAEMGATVRQPEVKAALADIGMEAIGFVSADSESHLRADIARWRLVGRIAGIQLN